MRGGGPGGRAEAGRRPIKINRRRQNYGNTYRKRRGGAGRALLFILLFVILIITAAWLLVMRAEARMLPPALDIVDTYATNELTDAVSRAVDKAMAGVETSQFAVKTESADGKLQSLAANTALIDRVCAEVAAGVSEELGGLKNQAVPVPIGTLLGFDVLANVGPSIPVPLRPMGNATADYDTKFVSAGINQTEFQVTLIVTATIRIVNPIQDKDITVTRRVALVDTVINGEVPQLYFGGN